jgi:uncharacterized protein YfaS (alpha-2-macroglobulin family)
MRPTFVALLLGLIAACHSGLKKEPATNTTASAMNTTNTDILKGDYPDEWKVIDSLDREGLYQSALERTDALFARAKSDKNSQQVVKALLFRGKYTTMLQEDGLVKAIQLFEKETATSTQPEKAVLQSLLGELYATYLSGNAWRLNGRTPVPGGEGGDILTWSADQIERRALDLYSASVSEAEVLKKVPVDNFRDITTKGQKDTVQVALRPTLYDLLAHRALAHFANDRSYLTEPAYAFQLDQQAAFAPVAAFNAHRFNSEDKDSGKWRGIELFQKVLAAHQNDANPAALIDADLLRLRFALNNSTRSDKDSLYGAALQQLHARHQAHPADGEILHALAQWHYLPKSNNASQKPADNRQAVAYCEEALRTHPDTYGAAQCKQLLQEIRRVELTFQTEQVNLPEKPVLVSVEGRNISDLWVKVVRIPTAPDYWDKIPWENRIVHINGLVPVQQRTWKVENPKDYISHRTEIAFSPLPPGEYVALISTNATFDEKSSPLALGNFAVSNIASMYFRGPSDERGTRFIIAHRQTGMPMPDVVLEAFTRNYNNSSTEYKRQGSATTDKNGMALVAVPENVYGEVRATGPGNDTLWVGNTQRYRNYNRTDPRYKVHFFTDRSLYRPGQSVYFKGVLYERATPDVAPSVVANRPVTVRFYDANGQEKSKMSLRSNEYGTFNGVFTAPASGLTGQMSIRADDADGIVGFNVEEYKRPKFEVTFDPQKEAFRLDERITVQGKATAYAGNTIDGAKVTYRVVRRARFPYWDWSWWKPAQPASDEMEIANGESTTNATGQFTLVFQAIPDRDIQKKDQPVFDYVVMADVTDGSGETRSGEQVISIGYTALNVEWNLSEEIEADSLKKIKIKTTNLAGQPLNVEGRITITRLEEPRQQYIQRYWPKPDLYTMTREAFQEQFPNIAYQKEDEPDSWTRQDFDRPVLFNTARQQTVDLHGGRVTPGYYLVQLTAADPYGDGVTQKKIVRVWDNKNKRMRFAAPASAIEKNPVEPGETARIALGGIQANLYFFFALETRAGALDNPRWLRINGTETVEIPVTENDRGGLNFHWMVVRDNRFHAGSDTHINVPWSNKELNIQFETFRDKLQPGQQEEWRLRITGPQKEKVAAEMVAALYDASLDQFLPHQWSAIAYPHHYRKIFAQTHGFSAVQAEYRYRGMDGSATEGRVYPALNWFDFPMHGENRVYMMERSAAPMRTRDSAMAASEEAYKKEEPQIQAAPAADMVSGGRDISNGSGNAPANPAKPAAPPPALRRNLKETVFFFPEIRTDADGNVLLKFTMNEALTRWNLLTYAHTKSLQQAIAVKQVITQKELMIQPNAPRFLREGDEVVFPAKVVNLTTAAMSGKATLTLLDAATLQPLNTAFGLTKPIADFTVPAGQSTAVGWDIRIPEGYAGAVTWQAVVESTQTRDGEENTLPVVSNRMLVTETLPLTLRGNQTKTFSFDNFKNGGKASESLVTQQYALEFTSNPAWYAVQTLPYLMEYPHECSEQVFSRFYANTLAASVTGKMPNIRRIYDRWKGTDALKSNLSKNQELKYALLEETPWVMQAQSEEQQKQNIALLFDLNRMADEQERTLSTLSERQGGDGGWAWFPGGPSNWYITQHIAAGFGHLDRLQAYGQRRDVRVGSMTTKALAFCTSEMLREYNRLEASVAQGKAKMEDDHLDGMAIHYLYTRSFYSEQQAEDAAAQKAINYYLNQATRYWLGKGLYQEGMLALALHRSGRSEAAQKIVASLRERALVKEELGMYWAYDRGYYWYQLPIETQALMVEVFSEVTGDKTAVENLRIWLLKNKQTNRWESTKATAEAVYALLLNGDNWLNNTQPVQITLGNRTLKPAEYEAGTGYFKQSWGKSEVKPSWSTIRVENPNSNIVWGAAYWQYFEDLDKITNFQKTPLTIVKQLFKEKNSPTGPILEPIADGQALKPGDKIKVRVELRADRPMEFVHLKDMRAAAFEPVNVLSGYRWQAGLGYYESTKDLATHFFIDYLPRGTFVFEYPLFVSTKGNYSNGITTAQCMYAPEFTSHSKGIRVKVE